ncbi:hypothetical protein ACFQY9_25295 [Microvirga aerilata]|uniref:hypothetical protein n=1 Tax=Microvirga aerilata TaxID=670292 RepID=UPI00362F94EA
MFVFDLVTFESLSSDRIVDFNVNEDRIELSQYHFSVLALGALAAENFHIGAQAQTRTQHLIYNQANGKLFYDVDGSGRNAAVEIADFDAWNGSIPALTREHFRVVEIL